MSRKIKKLNAKGIFVVRNTKGLHTRPSTEIVKCASKFKSEITLTIQDKTINAKSLLDILMLAAGKGAKITVEAEGIDANEAVDAILKLADLDFNMEY